MAGRIALRSLAASAIAAGAGGTYMYETDEGTRRAAKLYRNFAPILLHYRAVELKHSVAATKPETEAEADAEWAVLHEKYADEVLEIIRDLKGFYTKYGQVLAGRSDMLPDIYIDNLRTLEDAVPPVELPVVESVICSSLGVQRLTDAFSEFDAKPLGSASIGQVHRARLKSTGEEVAVKIQYPDAERLFRQDIKTARGFCKIFAPEQLIMFDEVEKQFMGEFDYRKEGLHMDRVRHNMQHFKKLVKVPKPHLEMTTKEVLVMEYFKGKKLYDAVKEFAEKYAATQGKTFKDLEKEARAKIMKEGFPAKYSGPSATQIELYRRALMARDAAANLPKRCANVLLARFSRSWMLPLSKSDIPPNSARIMDTLLRVHGHQILVNGYFNGDCHAGNVLLLPDGRLGLIDYGQVKELTEAERLHICRVLVCMSAGDKAALKQLAIESGYRSKYMDQEVIYTMTRFALDTDGPEVCKGLNFQQFVDEQFKRDPWSDTDAAIIMPVRTAFMMRGIGLMLNHPVSVAEYWTPIAKEVLKSQEQKQLSEAAAAAAARIGTGSSDSSAAPLSEEQRRALAYEKLGVKFLM